MLGFPITIEKAKRLQSVGGGPASSSFPADPAREQTHAADIVSLAGLFLRSGEPSLSR